MSSLFLSHSSKDDEFAEEVRLKLEEQGHRSVFLDFDPEHGIPGGRDWEQELYRNLRLCRGMIVLCSPHSMSSRWCFAEITHAKSLGKPIFPLKIAPCEIDSVLTSGQTIDLTQEPDVAYQRLWRGLVVAGLDAADAFDWDGTRPPFPGLRSFREEDAAIFFGRDAEIQRGLEKLQRLRQFGGARLLMILGASGSGKSSLVKAGLMPRLRRDLDRWLPLESFRPGNDPLRAAAIALSRGFQQVGLQVDWRSLRQRLAEQPSARSRVESEPAEPTEVAEPAEPRAGDNVAAAVQGLENALRADHNRKALRYLDVLRSVIGVTQRSSRKESSAAWDSAASAGGNALVELTADLAIRADRSEARILLVIDQFEELLGHPAEHPANRFLELLAGGLHDQDSPLQVIGTMRSDYLGMFQKTQSLLDLSYETLPVGPMSSEGVVQTIVRPAALAALDLEPGLVETLVQDAGAEDSLPLLAFTMRRLWEQHRGTGVLRIEDYRDRLGGLADSVARAAESALSAASLSREQKKNLRRSFLSMARINEEGRFARRQVAWHDVPHSVHEVLEQFVQARLLVSSGEGDDRILEVAHEALFQSWHLLRNWLDEDREFLLWRKRLLARKAEWQEGGLDEELLLRGVVLTEAEKWLTERPEDLDDERGFIEDSIELRTRFEKLERRRRRRLLYSVSAAALVFLTLAALAWKQSLVARHRAAEMRAGLVVRTTRDLLDPAVRALLLVEAADMLEGEEPAGGAGAARAVFGLAIPKAVLRGHRAPVSTVEFSPDDSTIVTASNDGTATIWRTDGTGVPLVLKGPGAAAVSARFSPDGTRVVTAFADGSARISSGERVVRSLDGHDKKVWSAQFSQDGSRVVTASADGTARVWSSEGSAQPAILEGHRAAVRWAGFSPDDSRILTVSEDGTARLWPADGQKGSRIVAEHADEIVQGGFSPDGSRLITASLDGTAQVCTVDPPSPCTTLAGHDAWVWSARFNQDGSRVVTASADRTARLWSLETSTDPVVLRGHSDWVRDAVFAPDGSRILLVSHDGDGSVWNAEHPGEPMWLDGHEGWVRGAAFSHDGTRVATASDDDTVRIWSSEPAQDPRILTGHSDQIWSVAFSSDDSKTVTASADSTARIWDTEDLHELAVLTGHEQRVRSAEFSSDGARILTASDDGTARIWNVDGSGRPIVLKGHRAAVLDADFSHDEAQVVTASYDQTIGVWDAEGHRLETLEGHTKWVRSATFSRDDSRILSASADRTARIWTIDGSEAPVELRGHTDQVMTAAFNHDESMIVTASADRTARVWNADGSGVPISLEGHESLVWSAAFSPDGSRIVTASADHTGRVWNADGSGDPVMLAGHSGPVWNAVFSREGNLIATASADGTVRLWGIWQLEWPKLVEDLRRQTTACLTPTQRTRYLLEKTGEAHEKFEACERSYRRLPPLGR